MNKYYARICWNSNGWRFPSGDAKVLEKDSYVSKTGFGHEEWLFNFAWLIDGYHYAFLQPIRQSFEKVKGSVLEIGVYAINPNRDRIYIAKIENCEVLTKEQSEEVRSQYEGAGWLENMTEQVRKIGGDTTRLDMDVDKVFGVNVRFRPEDVQFDDPPRIAAPGDFIAKLDRYTLVKASQHAIDMSQRRRKGTKAAPTVRTITRSGQLGITYDPIHKALQAELFKLLKRRFGKDNVVLEADFVDISISKGKKRTLVEIKSDPNARRAIREGLGQLLEYAYFHGPVKKDNLQLMVVAPGPKTEEVSAYLKRLQAQFGIPIQYCTFSLGHGKLPAVFD